jgi:hypothetical protein
MTENIARPVRRSAAGLYAVPHIPVRYDIARADNHCVNALLTIALPLLSGDRAMILAQGKRDGKSFLPSLDNF